MKKLKVQRINQELLSKRWNIIIHGIPQDRNENDDSIEWESRQDSKKKVQTFFSDALQMSDDDIKGIAITDAHRLHVRNPVPNRHLPLIFKLGSLLDKKTIYEHLSNLKGYNEINKRNVFVVMEHLPEPMQDDRKKLISVFKKAKIDTPLAKRVWFADRETGRYCLKVGDVIHKPE